MIFCKGASEIKLMTLNTHSHIEDNYQEKLHVFAEAVLAEMPDIIAMQEVNQSSDGEIISSSAMDGYISSGGVIKTDNHALNAVNLISEAGVNYNWTYLPIKNGYGCFDEGLAVLSRTPIDETESFTVSFTDSYSDWKTRKILGIRTMDEWFYSVHLGWWDDEADPFEKQWKRLNGIVSKRKRAWLMGDFNNPAQIRNEGYDLIKESGWHDSFELAQSRDSGVTVNKPIDGWHGRNCPGNGLRIDCIFTNTVRNILSSQVIFNEKNYPVVSDHYGIITEVKGGVEL